MTPENGPTAFAEGLHAATARGDGETSGRPNRHLQNVQTSMIFQIDADRRFASQGNLSGSYRKSEDAAPLRIRMPGEQLRRTSARFVRRPFSLTPAC